MCKVTIWFKIERNYYYIIAVLVFGVVFFGTLIILFASRQTKISSIRNQQEIVNNKAEEILQSVDFKRTKTLILNDYATYNQNDSCKKRIVVDTNSKKICFIDYIKGSLIIVGFNEILDFEIYENGSHLTNGCVVGGLWAGLFGSETSGLCKELKLIIRINRYDISQVCYEIIFDSMFNIGINKSTTIYQQCISTLYEVVSFLEF